MKKLVTLLVMTLLCGSVRGGEPLELVTLSRHDLAYSRGEIKVNNSRHVAGSPKWKYDPKFTTLTGFQSSTANTEVISGTSSANGWSTHLSGFSSSVTTPVLSLGARYNTLCVVGANSHWVSAYCSGHSDDVATWKHPGGTLTGSIKLTGKVKGSFIGYMIGQLGDSTLIARWVDGQWHVIGTVNGVLVDEKHPSGFSKTWTVTQPMDVDATFIQRGALNSDAPNFVTEGLKSTAYKGSGGEPVVADNADMTVEVRVN